MKTLHVTLLNLDEWAFKESEIRARFVHSLGPPS